MKSFLPNTDKHWGSDILLPEITVIRVDLTVVLAVSASNVSSALGKIPSPYLVKIMPFK